MRQNTSPLRKSITDIEKILDSITDGFFILDRDFNFTYVNTAFERIIGRKKEDLIGTHYWTQFPKAVSLKFYTEYRRALHDNVSVRFEEQSSVLQKWVVVNVYPIPDGLLVFFTDITEQRKQTMLIASQNERLKEIAWIESHKVRKPVATILGLAQLFNKDTPEDPTNEEILKGIIECAVELDMIIEEINDKTRDVLPDLDI